MKFTIIILVIIAFAGCKKEANMPEVAPSIIHPCDTIKPVSAAFKIFDHFHFNPDLPEDEFLIEEDTNLVPATLVTFEAIEAEANYTWFLGAEVIHEKSFARNFNQDPGVLGKTYSITLIVEKEPNTDCNPFDNGMDTLTRSFTFAKAQKDLLVYSSFWGAWDSAPKDSFEIKIDYDKYLGNHLFTNFLKDNEVLDNGDLGGVVFTNQKIFFFEKRGVTNKTFGGFLEVNKNTLDVYAVYDVFGSDETFRGTLIEY